MFLRSKNPSFLCEERIFLLVFHRKSNSRHYRFLQPITISRLSFPSIVRQVEPERRIHVYERCSQFSILQRLPTAYMWASPMPRRALEQYHLVLKKCPAQRQQMRDVLVYPDKGRLRPEEQAFVDLLHKEAASTVK
mgnify:CR=1 FL=1